MRRTLGFGFITGLILLISAAQGWSDILVTFEGNYNFGLYDAWKWETDGWGEPGPNPGEILPGLGGTGSAQAVSTTDGTHYILKTMEVVQPGLDYQVSVWIRVRHANQAPPPMSPFAWVEFGWDPQARDTTQPNSNLIWNVDPKNDFDNNFDNWVQYTGEPFTAVGTSVTVAFKIGTVLTNNPNGITADFDNLEIRQVTAPPIRYAFPDHFDTTYTLGLAHGWTKRFIPGGLTPHWAEATGRGATGSAQRIYAGAEGTGWDVNIGAVKRFAIDAGQSYNMTMWISASDSQGAVLTNPNADPGPVVKFGLDLTGQNTDPLASSIEWNTEPTGVFSTPGMENTWQQFTMPYRRPTTDTVSVWLWVQGDFEAGVDAAFDDLEMVQNLDLYRWSLYP